MMKPEEKSKLKTILIEVYEGYVRNRNDSDVKNKAQKIFFDYIYNNSIIDRDLVNAIQGLEHIGWEFSRGLNMNVEWKMKEDEAREILGKLKN
jgi:hypothetical protein